MSTTPPDRLSVNPLSPFFEGSVLERGIGVRFKGIERNNIEEYCISEGWVRLPIGKSLDRHGNAMTVKTSGEVEVWFLDGTPAG